MHQTDQPLPSDPPMKHILVADDDASTRHFFSGALTSLGYGVSLACDGVEALAMAKARRYDALLLDCRMPLAGGAEVFDALRRDPAAASRHAVMVATSAEVPAELRDALIGAGFAAVIEKPCRLSALEQALTASLGAPASDLLVDDEKGMAATGDAETLEALRALFHEELTQLESLLETLAGQPDEFVERLHRLRSGCGFCGTARLGAQARALQNHIMEYRQVLPAARERFAEVLTTTLAALASRASGASGASGAASGARARP